MSLATLIRSMSEAGATPEAIALAVEAIEQRDAVIEARRAAARDRKRRQRAGQSQDSHATVTGQSGDNAGHSPLPSPPPFSPPTPPPISPTPTNPSKINRHREIETEFEERFWPAYPRRVAKEAGLKAFRKAREKASLAEILNGIATYRREKPEYADWAHPASWLNAGRWGDDYSAPKATDVMRPEGVPEFKTEAEFEIWWANRHSAGAA